MKIVEVESSAILKIGYDGDTLFVQFVSGDWYKYFQVPETVFEEFCNADSQGQFFNVEIKPKYPNYERCRVNPVL